MKNENQTENQNKDINLPPLFKTWKQLYTFVLIELVVCIIVFYVITISF